MFQFLVSVHEALGNGGHGNMMVAHNGAFLIIAASLLGLLAHQDNNKCPSFAENPSCPCYNFEDGIFLECPAATAESLRHVLQVNENQ